MRTDRWLPLLVGLAFSSTSHAEIYFDKDQEDKETCEESRKEPLRQAVVQARQLAADAVTYMTDVTSNPNSDRRNYETWFGAFDMNRAERVSSNMQAIRRALRDEDVYIDCRTDPKMRCGQMLAPGAYVDHAASTHRIYICSPFWDLAEDGQLSRGGAMFHEVSHFDSVAGTRDIASYNTPFSCQALANGDPETAIKSSFNHQFFAESYPLISPWSCHCAIGERRTPGGMRLATLLTLLVVGLGVRAAVRARRRRSREAK